MSRKLKIALITGAALLTCGLYTWGIPAFLNTDSNRNFAEEKIFETSGYRIDLGKAKISMGVFPSVWLKSDNISIYNDDKTKALSIDNPKLKLKLFPLLRKKIEISKLSADREDIYLVYSKDSEFMLGQYPLKLPEKKSEFALAKIDMNLGNYNIFLDDRKNAKKISLLGEYINHGKYIQNKHLELGTKGIFNSEGKSTNIFADIDISLPINRISENKYKIDAEIKDFDLSAISDYAQTLSGGYLKSLGGIVNISAKTTPDDFGHKNTEINIKTDNLKIEGQELATSIIFKDQLSAILDFGTVDNGILINKFRLKSKRINAGANGKLYNLGHKAPTYDIKAFIKDSRAEDIIALLPGSETLLPDFNLYKLKKYVFYGDGNARLHFKGQGTFPKVNGYVKIRDGILIKPLRGAPGNAEIDLKFKGHEMFVDVFVPATGVDQSVTVKGKALIDGTKYSELNIKSTNAVQLAPAQEVLLPLHEILKFQLGPVPMMKATGVGNIDMRSAGRKIDPHLWGTINFSNATASLNDIHDLEITNGSGEVVFNDKKVTFKTHSGILNGKPIEIKGDCEVLGKLNVYVTSKAQDVKKLIHCIQASPILVDVQKVVKPFTRPDGIADVFLHIYGNAKNTEEIVFNEDLFAKGTITLHNSTTQLQDTFLPFRNVNGVVNFDQYNCDYNITGDLRKTKAHVWGTGTNNIIDLKVTSDKVELNDIFDLLHSNMQMPFKNELGKLKASFNAAYKGSVENNKLDYNKLKVDGKIIPNINSNDPIRLDGGTFTINNGYLRTSNLKGFLNNNPFNLSFAAKDLDKEMMSISDAKFNLEHFDLSSINTLKNQIPLPKETAKIINNISDIKGLLDITGTIKNGRINADTDIDGISFKYTPLDGLVRVLNGRANIRNNILYLDKVNSRLSSMPVFIDGRIANIYSANPDLKLYISSKLTQQFFDRFFNSKSVYPVKAKGDINFYSRLSGKLNALNAKSTLKLAENSSIYYMGAMIAGAPTGDKNPDGQSTNPVTINSDINLYPDRVKINMLDYHQTISSQNKKKSDQTQLKAFGEISLLPKNIIGFKNLKIKTENPTNARIFNILFKKPIIKQGIFTSDLTINGTSETPNILGFLKVKSVDIPLMDSTIQDVDVDFKKDYININTTGLIMTNDFLLNAKLVNKSAKPVIVEQLNAQTEELNLNTLITELSEYEADTTRAAKLKSGEITELLPENTIIIKDANIVADNILIKKAKATNFKSHITLDENRELNIDKFSFNIAKGTVDGNIKYNLKSLKGRANVNIKDTDAQIIADDFFEMPGQIYGTVTGNINAKCTGLSGIDCVNTLSGNGNFEVTNGRMPKLGSLEYLLKAGNLITGGVTGVSINGIIDLITPLKTGQFSSIKGDIHVKDGIADNINVYSSGKDLSMYMTGNYNLSTLVADMEIYGALSKNFSTILGKIANASLNTLFNTIPGIKINDINPTSTSNIRKIPNFDRDNVLRVFKAEIYGDINGNNYVKSFRWIKD